MIDEREAPQAAIADAEIDPNRLPVHVAIVMDGNGRWAQERRLPSRLLGHQAGYKTAKQVVRDAWDLGIKVVTLYVFSNENWRRPRHEVEGLMKLYEHAIRAELSELNENQVRMCFSGRREGLTPSLLREMENAERVTQNNKGLILNLALNYGGRAEIVDAVKQLAEKVKHGDLTPQAITEETISSLMYSPNLPDPDLVIRTAGECRISNFLLWEIAYAELWVTPVFWPDFNINHLKQAIASFQQRVRKFGGIINPPEK